VPTNDPSPEASSNVVQVLPPANLGPDCSPTNPTKNLQVTHSEILDHFAPRLPMNSKDETRLARFPEINSAGHLSAEAGFTTEMEARILNAWEESKDPAHLVGPFDSAEAFISYLKSSNEPR
jgi:hypothetical protein